MAKKWRGSFLQRRGSAVPLISIPARARAYIFLFLFFTANYTPERLLACVLINWRCIVHPQNYTPIVRQPFHRRCQPPAVPFPAECFVAAALLRRAVMGGGVFLGEGGCTGRAVLVCASLSQNQAGQGAETRQRLVRATRQVVRTAGHFASPRQYALAGIYLLWSFLGAFHAVSLGGYGESRTFEASGRLPVQHCRHVRNNCS